MIGAIVVKMHVISHLVLHPEVGLDLVTSGGTVLWIYG